MKLEVYLIENAATTCRETKTIHKIFETCEIVHYGKSLISVFQQFFTIIDKIFILAGRLGTRLSFYGV